MKKLLLLCACAFVFASATRGQQDSAAEAEYEKFADAAIESFRESSGKVDKEYGIGNYDRWDFDQTTRQIVFSDNGGKKLIADAQIIGSWAANQTWLWAWDNKTIDEGLKKDAVKVREVGKKKKFWRLTTPQFMSGLEEGWALTAIAGHITKAKTAFRGQNSTGYVFFLITDVKWADQKKPGSSE